MCCGLCCLHTQHSKTTDSLANSRLHRMNFHFRSTRRKTKLGQPENMIAVRLITYAHLGDLCGLNGTFVHTVWSLHVRIYAVVTSQSNLAAELELRLVIFSPCHPAVCSGTLHQAVHSSFMLYATYTHIFSFVRCIIPRFSTRCLNDLPHEPLFLAGGQFLHVFGNHLCFHACRTSPKAWYSKKTLAWTSTISEPNMHMTIPGWPISLMILWCRKHWGWTCRG